MIITTANTTTTPKQALDDHYELLSAYARELETMAALWEKADFSEAGKAEFNAQEERTRAAFLAQFRAQGEVKR